MSCIFFSRSFNLIFVKIDTIWTLKDITKLIRPCIYFLKVTNSSFINFKLTENLYSY
jgi:hypothetical protein